MFRNPVSSRMAFIHRKYDDNATSHSKWPRISYQGRKIDHYKKINQRKIKGLAILLKFYANL